MGPPSVKQIAPVPEDLDQHQAVRNFLGKTVEQAELLFRENALCYQEDLMFMGPVAFRYYLPAFLAYLRSEYSNGDSDAANTFQGLIRFKLKWNKGDLLLKEVHQTVCYVLDHWAKYDCNPNIYVGLKDDYGILKLALEQT